eukprot:TRINITY_DN16436_c0_g1_i1.p1 TRINITY_DN16436_c0_g1~~TRINITY_DN16436_c0_g1_i1.p1  ORF type:complete len:198 (-),score=5.78 TRINITY_DN16436_c0_g1_i1:62-655(-)
MQDSTTNDKKEFKPFSGDIKVWADDDDEEWFAGSDSNTGSTSGSLKTRSSSFGTGTDGDHGFKRNKGTRNTPSPLSSPNSYSGRQKSGKGRKGGYQSPLESPVKSPTRYYPQSRSPIRSPVSSANQAMFEEIGSWRNASKDDAHGKEFTSQDWRSAGADDWNDWRHNSGPTHGPKTSPTSASSYGSWGSGRKAKRSF